MRNAGLEVHEHCIISGPRANQSWRNKIVHSHAGGDEPHQHEGMGPASYTIDKDEWYRATGLRGGGRKKFTVKPSGEQFPITELADWQKSFDIIIGERTPEQSGEGPGFALPARMIMTFGLTVANVSFPDEAA